MNTEVIRKCSFVAACRLFFGQKSGQTLKEFADELKCLTAEDRKEFEGLFPWVGFEITPP